MIIPPRRIVLSGGGMRAVAHLGALQVLESRGLLSAVKEYVGVSAGALVGFCLCIGYTLKELQLIMSMFDFQLIRNITPETMLNFPTTYGLDNGENLGKLLHSVMRIKGIPIDATFGELNRPIQFRCFASDLFSCSVREFSKEKTPTVKLTVALRASMCLPAYFTPIEDPITHHLLVDGGIMNNYPIAFLTPEERKTSLGIMFSYDHSTVDEIQDLGHFFYQIYACYYMPRWRQTVSLHPTGTIIIPCGHFPSYDFESTVEERQALFEEGRLAAEEYLERHAHGLVYQKPLRRYSVG
jgi:predicted acylesterase/phospholipase RssA